MPRVGSSKIMTAACIDSHFAEHDLLLVAARKRAGHGVDEAARMREACAAASRGVCALGAAVDQQAPGEGGRVGERDVLPIENSSTRPERLRSSGTR